MRLDRACRLAGAIVFVASSVAVGGCRPGLLKPTAHLDRAFTLPPKASVFVEDAGFTLALVEVTDDSRCPIDAICVHAGDASVHVRADDTAYEFRIFDPTRTSVRHGEFLITLVELQPQPRASRATDQEDYRATFRVTR